jgi:hypothetical protein
MNVCQILVVEGYSKTWLNPRSERILHLNIWVQYGVSYNRRDPKTIPKLEPLVGVLSGENLLSMDKIPHQFVDAFLNLGKL